MPSFVVFEGIDGTGKTTVLHSVVKRLEGQRIHITREPTDTLLGDAVRWGVQRGDPVLEALLFAADRSQHVKEIRRYLEKGYSVISDRYIWSSIAYQSVGLSGVVEDPEAWITELHRPFHVESDHVLLFVCDPDVCMTRISSRSDISRFERKGFLERVQQVYLRLAEHHGARVVDASRPFEDVCSDVESVLREIL